MFTKWFLYSENDFYIQQEIYIFSNFKFVFGNIRFIFSNIRFAFNEMKFIKLKSFTFNKPNLDVTKHPSKSIRQNEIFGLQVVNPVYKYFLALSERSLHIAEMVFQGKVLCCLLLSYWSVELRQQLGWGCGHGYMHVDIHKFFVWI